MSVVIGRQPLVWRVPPWQPALLFLLAAASAAAGLYWQHHGLVRAGWLVFAAVLAVAALVTARAFLVVDDDGVGWRRVFGETSISWGELDYVSVVPTKLRVALMVVRRTGGSVEIPSVLVAPTTPMSTPRMIGRLEVIARQIADHRPPRA